MIKISDVVLVTSIGKCLPFCKRRKWKKKEQKKFKTKTKRKDNKENKKDKTARFPIKYTNQRQVDIDK